MSILTKEDLEEIMSNDFWVNSQELNKLILMIEQKVVDRISKDPVAYKVWNNTIGGYSYREYEVPGLFCVPLFQLPI